MLYTYISQICGKPKTFHFKSISQFIEYFLFSSVAKLDVYIIILKCLLTKHKMSQYCIKACFSFIFVHNFIDNNLQTQTIKYRIRKLQACFDEYDQDLRYDINQIIVRS